MTAEYSRRRFLEFLGRSSITTAALASLPLGCVQPRIASGPVTRPSQWPFLPIEPSSKDELVLAEGLTSQVIVSWNDPLNMRGDTFGFNNDYLAFIPLKGQSRDGILWVNHEAVDPFFVSGYSNGMKRTRAQVIKEQKAVGGSLVRIRQDESGHWSVIRNDPLNRRLSGQTRIPLIAPRPIAGSRTAVGTLGNCAGGVTPWGTVLTCEENYDQFYGETEHSAGKTSHRDSKYGWEQFFKYAPEHYGWVVEVNPHTGAAKKLTALGRFAHECATTTLAADGRCVVYSGDDSANEHLYKFISEKPGSLEKGTLYVANVERGEWLSLDWASQPQLKSRFKDQTDILIRAREAAKILGATPLDRPEDIEIDPVTKNILVSLTMNKTKGNPYGSIAKFSEKEGNPLSMSFTMDTFLAGGEATGFACPDNLAFDGKGNLWFCCDVADSDMHKPPYTSFKNNALFYVPMRGPAAGQPLRIASAPTGAELTGPCFSPDGETLFLSVQHPGEGSTRDHLTSHWPEGGNAIPKPSVVALSGPLMKSLISRT